MCVCVCVSFLKMFSVFFVYLPVLFCSYVVVLCVFIFVCTSVGLLPPGGSPIAVNNNNDDDDDDDDDDDNNNNNNNNNNNKK